MGELPLRPEHEFTNSRMLSVRTDDHVDLPRDAALELDSDARTILRVHGPHLVTEDHFDVVGDRAKQDAHQIVSHDLDLAITTRLAEPPQRYVVGAPAIGPHGGQGQDLGAGGTDRGVESHPFGDSERGAADVDRVPTHPKLRHSLDEHRPVPTPHQPVRQGRAGDARTGDENRQRGLHSAKIRG